MKHLSHTVHNRIFVSIGTNVPGDWGGAPATIARCLIELKDRGIRCDKASSAYRTAPVGFLAQPDFTNMVLEMSCDLMPRDILNIFKLLEKLAGRRGRVRNGPRPLDLDLLSYRRWIVNWPVPRPRPPLVLPHPFLAERAFVLVPFAEIAPAWRHPVSGQTTFQMLGQLGGARHLERTGRIERLDWKPDL